MLRFTEQTCASFKPSNSIHMLLGLKNYTFTALDFQRFTSSAVPHIQCKHHTVRQETPSKPEDQNNLLGNYDRLICDACPYDSYRLKQFCMILPSQICYSESFLSLIMVKFSVSHSIVGCSTTNGWPFFPIRSGSRNTTCLSD